MPDLEAVLGTTGTEQIKIDAATEFMIDCWREAADDGVLQVRDLAITEQDVRETLEVAVEKSPEAREFFIESYDRMLDPESGDDELRENLKRVLSKHGAYKRKFIREDSNNCNIHLYLFQLPVVRLMLTDFFNNASVDKMYIRGWKRGESGKPYSLKGLLNRYSVDGHKNENTGTGGNVYRILQKLGRKNLRKARRSEREFIVAAGFKEEWRRYQCSRRYWSSNEIALAEDVLGDFFTKCSVDNKYTRQAVGDRATGEPFPLTVILHRYNVDNFFVKGRGPAANLYQRLLFMQKKDPKKAKHMERELLKETGYQKKWNAYKKSFRYWFSDEIELAREVLDDFFTTSSPENRYKKSAGGGGAVGDPYSLPMLLYSYSIGSNRISKRGTAANLYRRLYMMRKKDPKKAKRMERELLRAIGFKNRWKKYQESFQYWSEKEIAITKRSLEDFFADSNLDERYARFGHGEKNLGEPYSFVRFLRSYDMDGHCFKKKGTMSSLYQRVWGFKKRTKNVEDRISQLLEQTGFKQKWNEYQKSFRYLFSDEIELARQVLQDFFANTSIDNRYVRHRGGFSERTKGNPYLLMSLLNIYDVNEHQTMNHGTARSLYRRIFNMNKRDSQKAQIMQRELLKQTGFTHMWRRYQESSIARPYRPRKIVAG